VATGNVQRIVISHRCTQGSVSKRKKCWDSLKMLMGEAPVGEKKARLGRKGEAVKESRRRPSAWPQKKDPWGVKGTCTTIVNSGGEGNAEGEKEKMGSARGGGGGGGHPSEKKNEVLLPLRALNLVQK